MPAPRFVGDAVSWRWAERDGYVRPASPGPYRYLVGRRWGEGPAMLFIAQRPGTADARENDPLLENCERRAAMCGRGVPGRRVVVVGLRFFCSGCQRPVRLAYFEDETYKMSGRWPAALVWVLELREA